jgi:hypothetical protein
LFTRDKARRIAANIAKLPERPAAMTYTHIANGQIASAADDERRVLLLLLLINIQNAKTLRGQPIDGLRKNTKARILNYEAAETMTGKPGMKGPGLGGARLGAGRPKGSTGNDTGRPEGATDVTINPARIVTPAMKFRFAEKFLEYAEEMLERMVHLARHADSRDCEFVFPPILPFPANSIRVGSIAALAFSPSPVETKEAAN